MIYLKKFDNHAAYEAAESSLILPNVSLCVQENEVHYNPSTPPTPSHDYVDLGLPSGTKWATMNVGASNVSDYGNYYQYGKGVDTYQATSGQSDYEGSENPLATSADTAAQAWGGDWHMPTKTQFEELTANTTYTWTTINGINGGKFTAQNGNYVFFPAAGSYFDGSQYDVGSYSFYWSSTPFTSSHAYYLYFSVNGSGSVSEDNRYYGYSVRPVMDA